PGTASVTAEVTNPPVGAVTNGSPVEITFTAQAPDAGQSEIDAAPLSVIANGTSASTLTITGNDADGESITGLLEGAFEFGGLSAATVDGFTEVGGGLYTFSVTNTTAETVTLTVEVSGVALGAFP